MSMNEPCPLCKKMIPIGDVINNSCPHCGSIPPEVKKKEEEEQAIAKESSLLYPDTPPLYPDTPPSEAEAEEEQPPQPIVVLEDGIAPTNGELIGQLRGAVIKLENMANGASVERLKMGRDIKSLRQEVETLQGRLELVETPVIEDWSTLVREKGYDTEKGMLDDMYNNKKMSMRKMAEELGTSKFTVQKRMDKQGLVRRKVGVNKK